MARLTLTFFGAFQARLNNKRLENFRSAKVQGLLVYLVLNGTQTYARDVLATLFWPEEPETGAKQNLRQSLFRLRKVLGDVDAQKDEPYILVTRSTVQFNPASHFSLDVADFLAALDEEDLVRAVSLYHNDLLPDFSCDSPSFDDWLRQEREQLHRLALDALYQLTAVSLTQADFQTARHLAQKQLALEPWREEAHRQLMQALSLLGERTAALAQYETCRAILAEELGVDPAPETDALAQRIRETQLEQPSQQPIERQRLKIPFVGRKTEYETLVNAYRQATQQGLQLVTVQGYAGIGKTRLAEQFVTWAATQGADVLYGRSFATSSKLSYQPITHMLRQRVERENAPEDLLSDLWLAQLTRLLPELRDRYPDLPQPTQNEKRARQHLFEAVTRLIEALATQQPLVLFIDDWHWADAASLDLLHYAVVRWTETKLPILILLTLRQEAVSELPDLQSWLTKLNHATNSSSLRLRELSQLETAQLVQQLLTSEMNHANEPLTQFSDWLFTETDGQPLFLTETLKALVDDVLVQPTAGGAAWQVDWAQFNAQGTNGPILHGVQEIVQRWLERISPSARAVLTAVSVLAQHATFDHLCRVSGVEEEETINAIDELLGRQLLQLYPSKGERCCVWGGRKRSVKASFRKAHTLCLIPSMMARRRLLHRRAFETLAETATSAYSVQAISAADLAHHALNAALLAETIHYSLIAGNQAMALFATQVAITHFETVWQLTKQHDWPETLSDADRQALYVGLGHAYELAEKWQQAQAIYEAMIADAQLLDAPAMECLGLNRLATVPLFFDDDQQPAMALLKRARAVAEQHGDRRGMAETDWNLAHFARVNDDLPLAFYHAEQALNIARELRHPQLLARSLSLLFYNYAMQRQWDKVEEYATEANLQSRAANNLDLAAESQRLLGHSQLYLGRPQESAATLQEALTFSQQIENLWGQIESGRMLAYTKLELGQYGQAIRLVRQTIAQAHVVGQPGITKFALITWGIVQGTIMALDDAQQTLLTVLAEYTKQGSIKYSQAWVRGELCAIHALAGEWPQAYSYAKKVVHARGSDQRLPMNLTFWYRVEALLRGGDEALARSEVAQIADLVGNNRRYKLPLHRAQAVLAQWDGELDQAIVHLEAALALAQEIGLPGEAWPILDELGKLYTEQGDQAKAQQAYQDAAVIIHRLAETIDEEDLRAGFLAADPVRSVLEISEQG